MHAYTWSQGKRTAWLLAVLALVLISFTACDAGPADPTPAPQPTTAEQPARDFPLCGNNNILCR